MERELDLGHYFVSSINYPSPEVLLYLHNGPCHLYRGLRRVQLPLNVSSMETKSLMPLSQLRADHEHLNYALHKAVGEVRHTH